MIPEALQSPEVMDAVRRAAEERRIPVARLRVGSTRNSINPNTGMPEFFDLFPTKGSDHYCDRGSHGDSCEGWVPNFLKDKPGRYMPTADDLTRLPDAQKEHYARYYEGTGGYEDMVGKGLGAAGGLFGPVAKPVVRGIGNLLGTDGASREDIAKAYRGGIAKPRVGP